MSRERISGWGRTAWTSADVVEVRDVGTLKTVVGSQHRRGVIARGLGRAYGAAAQNAGGIVLACADDSRVDNIHLDSSSGHLTAPAGLSLDAVLRFSVPRGWFIPVTPGTRFVTLGGAVASDVHGKNHHVDGSFGQHVESMKILLSSGEEVVLSPSVKPTWFWSTVGGMGLTGVVTEVTVRMLPVESSLVMVETKRLGNLDDVIASMSGKSDDEFRYSVAWVDMLASGRSLGRGVLTRGNHATASDVGGSEPCRYDPKVRLAAPPWVPNGLLNKFTVRAFNEVWYRKAPADAHIGLETIPAFFHPLDGVRQWNALYGSNGFIQYQFIVPLERVDVLRTVIGKFSEAGVASFLAVLKRMGKSNSAPMSFPTEGWTLTLDLAAGSSRLPALLEHIDEMVLDAGGRHYLAKDAHVSALAVERAYPRLEEWKHIRDEMDPRRLWVSDLARRLRLVEEAS
ncbi:MAG: FAD-binding oxidoreductase [Actinobacteria bacterium]|nr:FAD-binding oxidoreductase [Actinomycetota bacterium]